MRNFFRRFLKAFVVSVAFVTVLPLFAGAPVWVEIGTSAEGDKTFADVESVKYVDGNILVWLLTNYATEQPYPYPNPKFPAGVNYVSAVGLNSFDCKRGRFAILQASYYAMEDMKGALLGSYNVPDKKISFYYPTPGTMGSTDLDFVCAKFETKKKK